MPDQRVSPSDSMMREAAAPAEDRIVLRLFVTGNTPRSTAAVTNATRLCREWPSHCVVLEIVDIYQRPEAAIAAQIIAAPTLVKVSPAPARRVIGDLTDLKKVVSSLGLVLP